MAHDVAKLIWEMAKEDKSMDGRELKDLFLKKIVMDATDLKKKLKSLVEQQIKSEMQPFNTELTLNKTAIFGGTANRVVHRGELGKYTYMVNNDVYYINNLETQMLIDAAIVPLDLKWKLDYNNNVVVSWKHWL